MSFHVTLAGNAWFGHPVATFIAIDEAADEWHVQPLESRNDLRELGRVRLHVS